MYRYIFKIGVHTVHSRPLGIPLEGYVFSGLAGGKRGRAARYTVGFEGLCAALRPRKHVTYKHGILLVLRDAVLPNLTNVDVIANMSDSEGSMSLAQTATASASTEQAAIKFNGNKFLSWRDARDEYTRVSNRGTSKVWTRVKLVGEDETKPFQLCCRKCGASCQLGNPAKWNSDHSQSACDRLKKSVQGGDRTAGQASQSGSASGAGMDTFAASKNQQEAFIDNLVKAMATSCIPFTFIENEYLRRAAASVGVQLPSRRIVSGTLLDRIFEESVTFSTDRIASMEHPAGASDGWRKKCCEEGTGLMNFTVNGDGEALLFDVKDCSGLRKDAQGIASLLSEAGCEVMGGKEHAPNFAGWTLDNIEPIVPQ
jgi:hypothetical protein